MSRADESLSTDFRDEGVSKSAPVSKVALIAGWILSVLPALILTMSGVFKFVPPEPVKEQFAKAGWDPNFLFGLGILELACTAIYLIPQTSVLGAILLTGYLGGAVATHVRVSDPLGNTIAPVVFGALLWGGLYLRDRRVRNLIPLRS
jgi:hypothetical protein